MRDALTAIEQLLDTYDRWARKPIHAKRRAKCELAYQRLLESLNGEVAAILDPLIAGQTDYRAAQEALRILCDAASDHPDQLIRERELAVDLGFRPMEIDEFTRKARRALKRERSGVAAPRNTADIRLAVEDLHERVCSTLDGLKGESKKPKKAHQVDAAEYARMQLWMIGALIANAGEVGIFHVSHATSIGMARVRPKRRKRLKIATADRPVRRDEGPPPLAEAA
jgi:hypothetical protein